jgi:hypothetical protein
MPHGTAVRHGVQPAIATPVLLTVCPRGAAGVHGRSGGGCDDIPRPARAPAWSGLTALEGMVLWSYPLGACYGYSGESLYQPCAQGCVRWHRASEPARAIDVACVTLRECANDLCCRPEKPAPVCAVFHQTARARSVSCGACRLWRRVPLRGVRQSHDYPYRFAAGPGTCRSSGWRCATTAGIFGTRG